MGLALTGATITFDPLFSGSTMTLTEGPLVLDKDLTIDGSALTGGLTISGNDSSPVFEIPVGSTVSLRSLTIADGWTALDGGCIQNLGYLTLFESTLRNCFALRYGGGLMSSDS